MQRKRSLAVLFLSTAVVGCAESAVVRSYPAGSKVYVNGAYEGLTPLGVTIPREQFDAGQYAVRLEHEGYTPEDGTLRTETCRGRIVGGVFTLGIVLLFKPPTCFASPQDFSLVPLPGQSPSASGPSGAPQATVDERLERLKRLRDQGTITNEEYEHYRLEVLKDL